MFKIKGFYVFAALVLSIVCEPVWAGTDTVVQRDTAIDLKLKPHHNNVAEAKNADTCYGPGQEVVDASTPCCQDLDVLTEVDTHRKFCDVKPGASSAWWVWSLILIFPFFLLVFAIFGIRNKMALRRNQDQPK